MNLLLAVMTENFLKAALEAAAINRTLQAEGRTELSEQEKARLRAATDTAQANSVSLVSQL